MTEMFSSILKALNYRYLQRHFSLKLYLHFMRFIFTTYIILFSVFLAPLMSQTVTVSPEVLLRDDYSYTLLGQVSDKILLVRNKGVGQTLSIYNEGLGFIQERQMNFEDRRVNLIGFVTTENDFNSYYSFKTKGVEYIKSVKMSPMGEVYYEDTLFTRPDAYVSEYYKFTGSDNDRYVVMYNVQDDKSLRIILYDNQEMELYFETILTIEGVSIRKDFDQIKVREDGTIGILFDKYNTSQRKEGHHYRLLTLDKNGNLTDQLLPFYGNITNDVELLDSKTGFFKLVGIYGKNDTDVSTGYFVFMNDSIRRFEFPEKMLVDATLKTKRKIDGLQNYMMSDVTLRKDGGYVFVMEANKEYYRTSDLRNLRGGAIRSSVTDYYNEDIVVLSISPLGELSWGTVLPKKQFSQDDDGAYSSFFLFKTPSKLHFIFNDEIKNNNTVSEYVLNPAGRFERNSVLSTAYQKLKLRLRNAIQISSSTFLLVSERNNRVNIVKIEY